MLLVVLLPLSSAASLSVVGELHSSVIASRLMLLLCWHGSVLVVAGLLLVWRWQFVVLGSLLGGVASL